MPRWNLGQLLALVVVSVALLACGGQHDTRAGADAAPESDAQVELDAEVDASADADASALDAGAADAAALEVVCDPPEDGGMPQDLFCTGLYRDAQYGALLPGVQPYTPGVVLWSDGADKHRYLYLPPGTSIDTSNMDSWRFPVGTKAWKEFRVEGALVETRLLWKSSAGHWESGTYVWDASGNRATLNAARKGTILASGYEIPAPKDCDKCHHGAADKLLGIEAVALALASAQGATLTSLAQAGSLSAPPTETHIVLPEDATGKAAAALGYLHANCGMPCHSTRGLGDETQLVLRLRADEFWAALDAGVVSAGADGGGVLAGADAGTRLPVTVENTDTYRATIGQPPTTASVAQAFPDAKRITRGSHELSLIWQLAHRRGNYQMPPLVSHRIDENGTQSIADWIDALPK
jgi:hypothetical protein